MRFADLWRSRSTRERRNVAAGLAVLGVVLVADGCGQHIEKGYIYFAMAFSFGVEVLNIRARAKRAPKPVELRSEY